MLLFLRKIFSCSAAVALVLIPLTTAQATEPVPASHPFSAEDLEAYFDPLVAKKLHVEEIAGAVVVSVKNGAPIYSDLQSSAARIAISSSRSTIIATG